LPFDLFFLVLIFFGHLLCALVNEYTVLAIVIVGIVLVWVSKATDPAVLVVSRTVIAVLLTVLVETIVDELSLLLP
jgi:hypothetical protein